MKQFSIAERLRLQRLVMLLSTTVRSYGLTSLQRRNVGEALVSQAERLRSASPPVNA